MYITDILFVFFRCCRQYQSRATQTSPLQKKKTKKLKTTMASRRKPPSKLTRKMSLFFGLPFQPNHVTSEKKASRVLGVVFFTFVICWAPFFMMNLVLVVCGESCSLPMFLVDLALWLGYTSSTINPIIYTVFNLKFRRSFVKLLLCNGRIEANTESEIIGSELKLRFLPDPIMMDGSSLAVSQL